MRLTKHQPHFFNNCKTNRLVTEGGDHHSLDRVHTVFGLVEHDGVLGFENVLGHFDAIQTELFVHVAAHLRLEVVVSGQTVHELAFRVACELHRLLVDLIGFQQFDTLSPDFHGFAHGDPNVSVKEVAAFNALRHIVSNGHLRAGLLGNSLTLFIFLAKQ